MRPLPVLVLMAYSLVTVGVVFDHVAGYEPFFRCPNGMIVPDGSLCLKFSDFMESVKAEEIKPVQATEADLAGRNSLPAEVFAELPPMPEEFWTVKAYLHRFDLCILGEQYWEQPEFYPDFFTTGIGMMLNPPEGRFGFKGYGAHPAQSELVLSRGGSASVCTFFKTSWFIERYQGVSFRADNQYGDYLDVSIEPAGALLGPTWGRFMPGWVQRIQVTVSVKPNAPAGEYVVGVNPAPPLVKDDVLWAAEHANQYTRSGDITFEKPFFTLKVVVR